MINMKVGKIRSVGVKPNHSACCSGAKPSSSGPPGLFTNIIPAIVMPRRISTAIMRELFFFTGACVAVESWVVVVISF